MQRVSRTIADGEGKGLYFNMNVVGNWDKALTCARCDSKTKKLMKCDSSQRPHVSYVSEFPDNIHFVSFLLRRRQPPCVAARVLVVPKASTTMLDVPVQPLKRSSVFCGPILPASHLRIPSFPHKSERVAPDGQTHHPYRRAGAASHHITSGGREERAHWDGEGSM